MWAMFEQGYYLHILEGTEEDPRDEKNSVDEQSNSETKEVSV